jgi:hypothetical protein
MMTSLWPTCCDLQLGFNEARFSYGDLLGVPSPMDKRMLNCQASDIQQAGISMRGWRYLLSGPADPDPELHRVCRPCFPDDGRCLGNRADQTEHIGPEPEHPKFRPESIAPPL